MVLAGGTTKIKGFSTRFTNELKTLIQDSGCKNDDIAVIDESQYNPNDDGSGDSSKISSAAWRGGTIIA